MTGTKLRALDPLLDKNINDLLHQKTLFIEHFYRLIRESVTPPFAISVDGLWGTGKTTIMKLLEQALRAEFFITSASLEGLREEGVVPDVLEAVRNLRGQGFENEAQFFAALQNQPGHPQIEHYKDILQKHCKSAYPTFWFNPWKYSQTQDVVLAFLQRLTIEHQELSETLTGSSGKMFRVLTRIGIGTALNIMTRGSISIQDVKEEFKEEEDKKLLENFQDIVVEIEKGFSELVKAIYEDKGDRPLIIFFDDLDRCLPDDAIELLEALKNLFVTQGCQAIFVCGIDTRVAKNFIKNHYDVEDQFAINYFRKIFNLTLSMPHSAQIEDLLTAYIHELYEWDDPEIVEDGKKVRKKAAKLAQTVSDLGLEAQISSVRKYLNIIHSFYAFRKFNPDNYTFDPDAALDVVVCLLIVKEAWQPLYEEMIRVSLQKDEPDLETVVEYCLDTQQQLSAAQQDFLSRYFKRNAAFKTKKLAEELRKYPTLA